MALVPAKCTQCGSVLKVEDTHDAAICEYCKTPFIIEKAVNIYHTVADGASDQILIKNAIEMMDIDIEEAIVSFKDALKISPNEWKAWKGLYDCWYKRIVSKHAGRAVYDPYKQSQVEKGFFVGAYKIKEINLNELLKEPDGAWKNEKANIDVKYRTVYSSGNRHKYDGKTAHTYLKKAIENAPEENKPALREIEKKYFEDAIDELRLLVKRMAKEEEMKREEMSRRLSKAQLRFSANQCPMCGCSKTAREKSIVNPHVGQLLCNDCGYTIGHYEKRLFLRGTPRWY